MFFFFNSWCGDIVGKSFLILVDFLIFMIVIMDIKRVGKMVVNKGLKFYFKLECEGNIL